MNQTPTFVSRMRVNQLQYGAAARLACGDLDGAWSKACEREFARDAASVGFSMSLSTKAMVLLARGDNEDARATLEHAVAVARELNGPLVLFPALQLLAVAEHRLGRIDQALAHLREGMRLARETRCITGRPLLSIALFVELAELRSPTASRSSTRRRSSGSSSFARDRPSSMPGHGRYGSAPSERSRRSARRRRRTPNRPPGRRSRRSHSSCSST